MGKFCTALRMSKCSFTSVNCAFATSLSAKWFHHFRFLEWRIVLTNISDKKAKGYKEIEKYG